MTSTASAAAVVVEPAGACTRKTGFVITEIMYKPASDSSLEFIEIYNSNPFEEEIGGYRLKGESYGNGARRNVVINEVLAHTRFTNPESTCRLAVNSLWVYVMKNNK